MTIGTKRNRLWWAAVLAAAMGLLGACGSEPQPAIVPEDLLEMDADQVLYGMYHVITEDGVQKARITADTAFIWQAQDSLELANVRLIVYTEVGRERAVVTSLNGFLNTRTQRMTARGDVVLLVRQSSQRLETSELYYDPPRNRIWSDSATVMTEGNTVTRGTGFEADTDFQNVRVENARVTGGRVRF
jgi:LPS export ABC transporter protein LptC